MATTEYDDISFVHGSAMLVSAHMVLETVILLLDHDREDISRADSTAGAMYDSAISLTAALDQHLLALQEHLKARFD